MKYTTGEYRARKASAHKAAVNLLGVIPWRIRPEPALMPLALQERFNVTDPGLVIIPSAESLPHDLEEAVHETGGTLLIIEPGKTTEGAPTYYITLVRSLGGEIRWTRALRLWLDIDRKAYLVPGYYHPDPDGICFALDARGVAIVAPPWRDAAHRDFGLRQADAVLLAP